MKTGLVFTDTISFYRTTMRWIQIWRHIMTKYLLLTNWIVVPIILLIYYKKYISCMKAIINVLYVDFCIKKPFRIVTPILCINIFY